MGNRGRTQKILQMQSPKIQTLIRIHKGPSNRVGIKIISGRAGPNPQRWKRPGVGVEI